MGKQHADRPFRVTIEGSGRICDCRGDQTLLQALTLAGVFLEAGCGGRGNCGKCRVRLIAGPVAGPGGQVPAARAGDYYLACQTYPAGDVTVALAEAAASAKGELAGEYADDGRPLLRKLVVAPAYPELADGRALQDTLEQALAGCAAAGAGIEAVRQLASAAATRPDRLTVTLAGDEIAGVEAGDTTGVLFAVAFDIGTTTVAGMLVDINSRRVIASEARTNPQAAFGADVISRIDAAASPAGLTAQAKIIRQCLNDIIGGLCAKTQVGRDSLYAAAIVGNTTMEHLLMEVPPASIAAAPYTAVFRQTAPFPAAAIGLEINPAGRVLLLPNIASFIGADTTAAILAVGQDLAAEPALMIDLGTNGEMALGNRERLWACSTACGPAFEGACIRDGMRAAPGAIDDVSIGEAAITLRTVAGAKPAGLCGSGVVKAVAELLKQKIITASGRFNTAAGLPEPLAGRLKNKDGQWEFVLVDGAESASGADIAVTQGDIRQIQLVKSAIATGVEILLEKAGAATGLPLYLAGAFGNYLDIGSALAIGLLPGFKREQVISAGNAAGIGAVGTLLSAEKLARCRHIAARVEYIELAAHPDFQKRFLDNLAFPEVI